MRRWGILGLSVLLLSSCGVKKELFLEQKQRAQRLEQENQALRLQVQSLQRKLGQSSSSTVQGLSAATAFDDVAGLPQESYINSLAQLQALPVTGSSFQPNQPITRGEYFMWLLQANNALFYDQPQRQIRPQTTAIVPFTDLPSTHPAFGYVEAYAQLLDLAQEGGAFRPDVPLTREELLAYKSRLDWGAPSPATATEVAQAWQFSDAQNITPRYMGAIVKDHTPDSTLRRIWGATTRLEPQQAVTRAEAAVSLWRIGERTAEATLAQKGR
jgi:hypothetical protein